MSYPCMCSRPCIDVDHLERQADWSRSAAVWLASTTELPHDEAARVIRKLSTTVGTRNGVRVLDTLIDLGWRPGGER